MCNVSSGSMRKMRLFDAHRPAIAMIASPSVVRQIASCLSHNMPEEANSRRMQPFSFRCGDITHPARFPEILRQTADLFSWNDASANRLIFILHASIKQAQNDWRFRSYSGWSHSLHKVRRLFKRRFYTHGQRRPLREKRTGTALIFYEFIRVAPGQTHADQTECLAKVL